VSNEIGQTKCGENDFLYTWFICDLHGLYSIYIDYIGFSWYIILCDLHGLYLIYMDFIGFTWFICDLLSM